MIGACYSLTIQSGPAHTGKQSKAKADNMNNSIQDQTYKAIQSKLARLCAFEYAQAPKKKNGKLKKPLTYSADVMLLLDYSKQILNASNEDAERIMSEITQGSIEYAVLKTPAPTAPALYRKIRFQRGTDKTVGLIVSEAKFKEGFSELSRLFPASEACKMQCFQFSPLFDEWDKAFYFNMDQGQGVITKQVNP